LCKVLVSNSSEYLEKQETNTLTLRFLTTHIIITHLSFTQSLALSSTLDFDVHEQFSF